MHKIFILISVCTLFSIYSFGQALGGISASKLRTLNAASVEQGNLEFEPSFGFANSKNYFDENQKVQPLFSSADSTQKFSGFGFRITYGIMKNMEIGVSMPTDMSEMKLGGKYRLPFDGKWKFSLLGGYNMILGNKVFTLRNTLHETTPSAILGFAMTYDINEKFSIDFDAQYQKHTVKTIDGHSQGIYLNTDAGYYIFDGINFIVGVNYNCQNYTTTELNSFVFSINAGLAIERAKNFILVLNAPFDILGKNEYQTKGFGMAVTILLD